MRWFAPPTRREITLLLFCLTVFTLAYNFENSVRFLGFDASAMEGVVPFRVGHASSTLLKDGRRPAGLRDWIDDILMGNHDWEDGQVIDEKADEGQALGVGPHSAMWMGRKEREELWPPTDEPGVEKGFRQWNDQVPKTTLLKHSPGYTILDQVIMSSGTVYIVTDTPESFPAINSITTDKWEVISSQTARSKLGRYGGLIQGVSWMCTETLPQNTTLLSLWSIYSSLESSIPVSGITTLPSPSRLILPQTPVFADPDYDRNDGTPHWKPRPRSPTGFHPFLAKAILPHMGIMYKEDWADYMGIEVPYVIERLVVADHDAAGSEGFFNVLQRATSASQHWWEPLRRNMAVFFDEYDDRSVKPDTDKNSAVYVHRPGAMRVTDHDELVRALNKLGKDRGFEVNVVEAVDEDGNEEWGVRMGAIVKATMIIAVHGSEILDGAYLKPSSSSTMLELFPRDAASREHEAIAKSLGFQYIAWSNNRQLSSDEISSFSQSSSPGQDVPVDANSVVQAIADTLR